MEGLEVFCGPQTPRELLVGELDLDWLDRNESTVTRLVGTVSFMENANSDGSFPVPTVVRFGILCTEDTDRLYQTIDLFDGESLEQFEWMWLQQLSFNTTSINFAASNIYQRTESKDIPLDVRTRRKLGHKDSVVMYAQKRRVLPGSLNAADSSYVVYSHQLRAVALV